MTVRGLPNGCFSVIDMAHPPPPPPPSLEFVVLRPALISTSPLAKGKYSRKHSV